MISKVAQVQYDCKVFFYMYNRQPIKEKKMYEDVYYEVRKGLQTINVNLNKDSMGSASIILSLPLQSQFINNVLIKYNKKKDTSSKKISNSEYITKQNDLTNEIVKDVPGKNYMVGTTNQEEAQNEDDVDSDIKFLERNALLYKNKDGSPISIEFNPILNEDFTECIFAPMDKVKIFMSNRFQGETIDDENINTIEEYSQVFEGLISDIDVSFNNGSISVSIMANDITKWLDLSQFNINPAIASNILDSVFSNLGVKPFQTVFAQKTLGEIIRILVLGYNENWIETTKSIYERSKKKHEKNKQETSFDDNFRVYTEAEQIVDWNTVGFKAANKALFKLENYIDVNQSLLDDYNIESKKNITLSEIDTIIIGENLTDNRSSIMPTEIELTKLKNENSESKLIKKYYVKSPPYSGCGNFRLLPKNKGLKPGDYSDSDTISLDTEYNEDKLWVDPAIPQFIPYRTLFNQFDIFQHNYQKRLEIIKEICAINEFEFFMDSTGILVCKIPDYNINPGAYISEISESSQYKNKTLSESFKISDDRFLIKSKDLISYKNHISDSNIKNYCLVTGDYKFDMSEVAWNNTNVAYNTELAKNFGIRIVKKNIPLLSGSANSEARRVFAKSWLNRHNAQYRNMNITIPLRPELQLAKTIAFIPTEIESLPSEYDNYEKYISILQGDYDDYNAKQITTLNEIKNKIRVGYISQINHVWSAGNICRTQIQLTHIRYWEQNFGVLSYKRNNVVNQTSLDYQQLESKYLDKQQQQIVAYKRHQTALNTINGINIPVDGQWGTGTRKAVNDFLDSYNQQYSDDQVSKVTETEDGFQRSDILAAMKRYGLYQ